ncbi:HD domain-containing protein [Chengkuizengella axinellae]|uniref:HD domain-containing protein n=1 Tax=Chengkuizengella axinellae TaxID=3064388 RepID=A0ABT9IYJ8_9BACL|nr:HD domain-containing protein [Chengkuizengella sp. 2205SS18-9]MDP5274435.1 HD domain-containing protein [Chengkuizengella sp. 2205SS18-9]
MRKTEMIIDMASQFAKDELGNDASGHDWWHVYRVTELAKRMALEEDADIFICTLSALLHDVADEKLNDSEEAGLKKVQNWLQENSVDQKDISHVIEIISTMSFKGGERPPMTTLEGKVVQDADRLDAIGAIGIARTFAYSGVKGSIMHDPNAAPRTKINQEEYRKTQATPINHFYEKLFKLKDLMNTESAKKIADERHQYMKEFVDRFYLEWDGKK